MTFTDGGQNLREYIQSLINEYLPEDKRFNLENLSDEEVLYFSDFLTGDLDYDEILNKYKKQEIDIKENCEHIKAFTEFYGELRSAKRDVLNNLNSLNQDILLEHKLYM